MSRNVKFIGFLIITGLEQDVVYSGYYYYVFSPQVSLFKVRKGSVVTLGGSGGIVVSR